MTPIMLDILIVAVVALFAFLGWRKGLILTLCGLVAVFVAYAGATFVSRTFSGEIAGILQPAIQNQIEERLEDAIRHTEYLSPDGDVALRPEDVTLSGVLDALERSQLFSGMQKMLADAVHDGLVKVTSDATSAIAAYLSLQIAQTLLFYLTFFLVLIAWTLLSHALDLACRLPVLSTFNAAGGLVVGLVKGAVIMLAVVWLLSLMGIISDETVQQTYLFRLYMNFQLL